MSPSSVPRSTPGRPRFRGYVGWLAMSTSGTTLNLLGGDRE
jgi:hypothetical protein